MGAPATISAGEVAAWVVELAQTYKPGTISLYLLSLRMLFDFVGLEPNVARDPRVTKPKQVREEPQPPSAEHLLAILEALGEKWRLRFIRPSRAHSGSVRLSRCAGATSTPPTCAYACLGRQPSATRPAGSTSPSGLIEAIESTCPLEDRVPERRVFGGISEASAYQAMSAPAVTQKCRTTRHTACGTAGSRSGTSPVCRRGSSRSEQGTHAPR